MNAVDTNVLIYACDAAAGQRHQRAQELLDSITDGVLLWQVACEFIAASRNFAPRGFTSTDAWNRLQDLRVVFPLQFPNVHVFDRAQILHLDRQCSFWDAMIYASCLDAGVTRIYSEDLPGASIPGLEVINPFSVPSAE